MSSRKEQLYELKTAAWHEMGLARAALSDAQRCYSTAKEKHTNAVDAWLAAMEASE